MIVYMAMVKSASAALTTITSFAKTQGLTVETFIVAGASKRGWCVSRARVRVCWAVHAIPVASVHSPPPLRSTMQL